MSSDKQTAANQQNAQASTGPHDTSRSSRNATRHGLLAAGVTARDQPAQADIVRQLHEYFRPVGPVEHWLVDQISLLMVRIERAVAIEHAYMAQQVQEHQATGDPIGEFLAMEARLLGKSPPKARPVLTTDHAREVNDSVGRYETALQNKLYRALHELERWQRRRQGESIPAPAAGDLNIHGPTGAGTVDVEHGGGQSKTGTEL